MARAEHSLIKFTIDVHLDGQSEFCGIRAHGATYHASCGFRASCPLPLSVAP